METPEQQNGAEVIDRLIAEIAEDRSGLLSRPLGRNRVYAITFDLKTDVLRDERGDNHHCYREIKAILEKEGFRWVQYSVYFGNPKTTPVHCVLAVQRLCNELSWFADSVRDIRMLRIEEENDLRPALPQPKLNLEPPASSRPLIRPA
jgi:virulence-associated protein VapD